MASVYLSTGSNQGNRLQALVAAAQLIEAGIGKIIGCSPVVESKPWGFESATDFYNQVLKVRTRLSPQALLEKAGSIEAQLGRLRQGSGYADRVIDIDILFYGRQIIDSQQLTVPHPQLHLRGFVLGPMAHIAPGFIHPVLHKTIRSLIKKNEVNQLNTNIITKNEFLEMLEAGSK